MRPLALLLLSACTSGPVIVDDIRVDTGWRDTGTPDDTGDTGSTSTEGDPLTLTDAATLSLAPSGGPYTEADGTWSHHEELNAGEAGAEVACDVAYSVEGSAATACDGCAWALELSFQVTSGDRSACHSPDAPLDDGEWILGWRAADSTLLLDLGGTWIPMYTATLASDELVIAWSNTVLYQD